jgi:hypothetical protein
LTLQPMCSTHAAKSLSPRPEPPWFKPPLRPKPPLACPSHFISSLLL